MKTYKGSRTIDGIIVTVDGAPLNERCDIEEFTDLGFEWTYEGASPRQLSLAILADHLSDDAQAKELSEAFMKSVITVLDNDWEMTSSDVDAALGDLKNN